MKAIFGIGASRHLAAIAARALTAVAVLLAAAQASAGAGPAAPAVVRVYAAASLTDVLPAVVEPYRQRTGTEIKFTFAASATLARQIDNGAAADLFVSADGEWMDYLEGRGLIRAGSRADLLGNRLALIAPADSPVVLEIRPGFALAAALHGGRLAVADPDSVPAGRYARAALTALGVWPSVAGQLVRAESVRGALTFVARGEAPLGIVYATDAAAERRVRTVALFPADSHPPVRYPLAETATASAAARSLATYLRSGEAAAAFAASGFIVPAAAGR
jgi:molybdate transport system substrate-binding protein